MRSPEVSDRSGCPELEVLAAFVEGHLDGAEQETVLEHLDRCDACREVVAESRALLSEVGLAPGGTAEAISLAEVRERGSRKWIWSLAAAFAFVSAGLGYFLSTKTPNIDSVMAGIARDEGVTRLPADWTDPRWPVMRGAEPTFEARVLAFRLGVRQTDLTLAIALDDRKRIQVLAGESAVALASFPFAEEIAARYRDLATRAGDASAARSAFESAANLAAREAREVVDEQVLALGAWAEAERLLASARSSARGPAPPEFSSLPSQWAEAAAAALEAKGKPDFAAREAAFERLVAVAGDLQ